MHATDRDEPVTPVRQLALGLLVLALTCLLSNLGSFRISPGAAIEERLANVALARLSTVGYFGQLGAGVWLAVALVLEFRRGARWALALWGVALCLFLSPLPGLSADLALGPSLVTLGVLLGLLGRALIEATGTRAA